MKPYNKDESKRIQVRRMLNNIAPYYAKICHILSFNIDRLWRKRLVKLITEIKPTHIVDIATGTGDVAISLVKNIPNTQIVGDEFTELLQNNGFNNCTAISLTNGIAHIYIGVKPKL